MPSPNQQKEYTANAYYHIYNRGVGRMVIFRDEQDYQVFLHYLRLIFSPLEVLLKEMKQLQSTDGNGNRSRPSSLSRLKMRRLQRALHQAKRLELWKSLKLLSFCLMPNHFHLVIYQEIKNGTEKLMRRLGSGYSGHYTHKYDWPGPVMQGRYNAHCLFWEPKLQTLAAVRYTERNPTSLLLSGNRSRSTRSIPLFRGIDDYPYSSLKYYKREHLENRRPPVWLNTEVVSDLFEEIKKKPDSALADTVASHKNYLDFITSPVDFSLEDVQLGQLSE